MNYKIIGADKQEYGPVTLDQMKDWILQRRANGQTMVQAEGTTEWKPLSSVPELAALLLASKTAGEIAPNVVKTSPGDDRENMVDLEVGGCLRRGWALVKENIGLSIGVTFVWGLAVSVAQATMIGALLMGTLTAGVSWFFLKLVRRQEAKLGDSFAGFELAFVQSLLYGIVSGALIGVGLICCIIPGIYLSVVWIFAPFLIIDRRMDFWEAMELSRKVVGRQFWTVFGICFMAFLLNMVGLLACIVGVFITAPIGFAALAYAYEDLFGSGSSSEA